MPSKKGAAGDLNAPLRSLSERLRLLQREAAQVLEAVRLEPRRGGDAAGDMAGASVREVQIGRMATTLLERWDIPTRADLDEINRRLDRIEEVLQSLQPPARAAGKRRTSKTRRRRDAADD